jgi:hypothetical protein
VSFIAAYPGDCAHCGDEIKDTSTNYANDGELVHTGCLIPYNTGVNPGVTVGRNEKLCEHCFQIHAGDCP